MIKQLFIVILCLGLYVESSLAQTVCFNEAKTIAKNHLLKAGTSTLKSGRIKSENVRFKLAKAEIENKDTLFYIMNDLEDNAFVIVSADERAWPILGYSTQGTFDEGNQPDAFKAWMEERGKEIAFIKANNLQANEKTIDEWNQLKSATIASQTSGVEPLLKTTWDQGCYYNEQCPADAVGYCGHVPTGCVATAMAQIMKYWNYPENGVGSSFLDSKYGQQFADFGASTYNWQQMPNSLTSSNNEIAKLMFHCGVATSVWYCTGGSSIYTGNVPGALVKNFSYSPNVRYISRGTTNSVDWTTMLRRELDSKRPVIYTGYSTVGHAFVCDGYQNDNYFHFNWGWGGSKDGYFYVENLTPAIEFMKGQEAIINICPKDFPQGFNGVCLATNSLLLSASKSITPVTLLSSVNWTVSCDQPWLKANVYSGQAGSINLEIIVEENSTESQRVGNVTISTTEYGSRKLTITQPPKINVRPGELKNILAGKMADFKSLSLVGSIDARDFKTMRDEMPMLETIDLANASIVAYSGTEGTFDNRSQAYEANTIPGYAFKRDDDKDTISSNLQRFIFPLSARAIDSYAFNKCANLNTIDIPEPISDIRMLSFAFCWFLTTINIPSTVKTIGNQAFMLCDRLQYINVDKNNANFSSLEGVLFDKNQTTLIKCPTNKQGSYQIPSAVKKIASNAFSSRVLNLINIPASVDLIESGAIGFCNASVIVDQSSAKYSSADGVLYNKNKSEILFCPSSKKGTFSIPETVIRIGSESFAGANISSVVIPRSVTSIGNLAFNSCIELQSVEIPSSVRTIEDWAFPCCYELETVKIPSTVATIGDWAFNCCTSLKSITVGHAVPLKIAEHVFFNFDKSKCILYVPFGSKAAYQSADQWRDFTNIVEMPFDHAPYLKNSLPNISAKPGALEQIIDLKTFFADDDVNDVLNFTVTSNSNSKIVTTKLDGSNLILSFSAVEVGLAEISVTAASNEKQVTSKFQVDLSFPTGNDIVREKNGLQVYPNPSEGRFQIRFNSVPIDGEKLFISDLLGRIVFSKKVTTEIEFIDLTGFTPGIYLLETTTKESGVHKIVIN